MLDRGMPAFIGEVCEGIELCGVWTIVPSGTELVVYIRSPKTMGELACSPFQ